MKKCIAFLALMYYNVRASERILAKMAKARRAFCSPETGRAMPNLEMEEENMKKKIALVLSLVMLMSMTLTACNGGEKDNGPNVKTKDTKTVAVGAVIIARDDVPEEDIYTFVSTIFENKDALAEQHGKGNELDLDFAASVTSVPYHPGAARYFAEKDKTVASVKDGAGTVFHRSDGLVLLSEVPGRAGVIRHRSDRGREVQVQLVALAVLLGKRILVLKNRRHKGVDVLLGNIVAGDDDSAHSNGLGVLGLDVRTVVLLAAVAGSQCHAHQHNQREHQRNLFLHILFLHF